MTMSSKTQEPSQDGWTLRGVITKTIIGYALFILIPLLIGIIVAVADSANAAPRVMYIRDLLWVIILLLTIPVLLGAGILLVQLGVLFGVIRVDAGSVLGEARGAFKAVSGTARFIGETVARPIIRFWTFFSGGWAFIREVTRLFFALRRHDTPKSNPESNDSTPLE